MLRTIFGPLYLTIVRVYLAHINSNTRIRDFLMWPLASRIVGTHYDDPITLKNKILMKSDLSDLLGRVILFYGPTTDYIWEPQTIRLMEILVKESRCAVIAGAHLGYTALMARAAMPRSSVVHTFEPIPYLYTIASSNAALNKDRFGTIAVHPEALSDKEGTVNMVIDSIRSRIGSAQENATSVSARTVSIDHLVSDGAIESPDFALFDVEGHELTVFAGMKNVLEMNPPTNIIFEVSPRVAGSDVAIAPYIEMLSKYGYEFYFIEDDYKCAKIGKSRFPIQLRRWDTGFKSDTRYYNVLATKLNQSGLTQQQIVVID